MKNKIVLLYFILIAPVCLSQGSSAFDKALSDISSDLGEKLKTIEKKKLVVLYIKDIDKQTTIAGKYLEDIVAYNLVNNPARFVVFDRNNLSEIADARQLYSEGYIDAAKAQELKKILGVDVIVIGNYTVLSSTIKLTLKALDSDNGFVIAASMKDLPLDNDARAVLGIEVGSDGGNNNSNRGFNQRPLNSNEQYNNPETVNKECEVKNTGDYCFTNNTQYKLTVYLTLPSIGYATKTLTLDPGQTQCQYFLDAKAWNYSYQQQASGGYATTSNTAGHGQGQILIEKCKSKTFIIK